MRRLNLAKYAEEELPVVPQISDELPSFTLSQRLKHFFVHLLILSVVGCLFYLALLNNSSLAEDVGNVLLSWSQAIRQNIIIVYAISVIGGIVFYFLRKANVLPPTHLAISSDGFKLYRAGSAVGTGSILSIYWADIKKVLYIPQNKSRGEDIIRLQAGFGRNYDLRAGYFGEHAVWESFFEMLREKAMNAEIDPQVYRLLEAPPDNNYTELWLSALSAPPARERMAPLAPKTALKDGLYFVRDQIGSGGQGTAYVAVKLDRSNPAALQEGGKRETVVLKEYVLPVHVMRSARKEALESLQAEAKLLQSIDHPNIVKMLDFFAEDHRGYLVFEHIRGKNLRQVVAERGALPETEVRKLAVQMCDILHYLHAQSPPVVHRDFTPDNLILDESGNLKLIDFNVAQSESGSTSQSSVVVGKPAYMPPEQFRGSPTAQSDIFAMGATLYMVLTGQEPEPLTLLNPRDMNPSISSEMSQIVSRCTEAEAADRYPDALSLKAALDGDATIALPTEGEPISIPSRMEAT